MKLKKDINFVFVQFSPNLLINKNNENPCIWPNIKLFLILNIYIDINKINEINSVIYLSINIFYI